MIVVFTILWGPVLHSALYSTKPSKSFAISLNVQIGYALM